MVVQRLGQQQSAAPARQHDPEGFVVGPRSGLRQEPVGIRTHRLRVHRQAQVGAGALQPLEMLLQREGAAVVDADDLEDPIPAEQPLVGGGNHRLGGGHDLAVEGGEGSRHSSPAQSLSRAGDGVAAAACPYPGEADDDSRGGGHVLNRCPLADRVVLVPAGEDVRSWQPHLAETRSIGASADRRADRLQPSARIASTAASLTSGTASRYRRMLRYWRA